jgi:hypothetical protein
MLNKDEHFTDRETTDADRIVGDALAEKIGDLYIDYMGQSPVEQWTEVAKALRLNDFDIVRVTTNTPTHQK